MKLLQSLALTISSAMFSAAVQAAGTVQIQVNNTMKPGGSEEVAVKKFAEALEAKAPGHFDVKPFLSGQLGSENAVLELLNIGETQISLTAANWRGQYAPELDPIAIPFLFPSNEAIEAYMNTPSGQKLIEAGATKGGLVHLGIQRRAPRHLTANRAISSPDDLNGLKLRLPGTPVWVDIWSAMGAQPVIVPAAEIYLAMQTGVVDGHENSLSSPYNRKLYEVQSDLMLTSHIYSPWHWVASKMWWDGLSKQDRATIQEAVDAAIAAGNAAETEKDRFYLAELEKQGMHIVQPDRDAFVAKARPAIDKALEALAPGVVEDVNKAIDAAGKAAGVAQTNNP